MMKQNVLNICQVSLNRDIPLILENFKNFKNFYENVEFHILCPEDQILEFKEKIIEPNIRIINENEIISFNKFKDLFLNASNNVNYKKQFEQRLNWYYQQILKISFCLYFIEKKKNNIIIWDADTIILKKINFFKDDISIKYGTFNEFHKEYFITNSCILGRMPNYYISFLTQFIAISVAEGKQLLKILLDNHLLEIDFSEKLSKKILECIFQKHKNYNGSMFSEYELIGQSNNLFEYKKQIPILSLRSGLNGKLTNIQKKLSKIFNFKHVTYEHSHPNKNSEGMLKKKQSWFIFIKIIVKNLIKFHLRKIKHNIYHILQ